MYTHIICVCVQIYARVEVPVKGRGLDTPGSGVTGSFEPPFLRAVIQTRFSLSAEQTQNKLLSHLSIAF